jgi:hypothetical protein
LTDVKTLLSFYKFKKDYEGHGNGGHDAYDKDEVLKKNAFKKRHTNFRAEKLKAIGKIKISNYHFNDPKNVLEGLKINKSSVIRNPYHGVFQARLDGYLVNQLFNAKVFDRLRFTRFW